MVTDRVQSVTAPPGARLVLLVTVLLLTAGACSSGGGRQDASAGHLDRDRSVAVEVQNRTVSTINVSVVSAAGRSRLLGQMTSHTTRTFEVSWSDLGTTPEIQLVADPVGHKGQFVSDPVPVEPGMGVTWKLVEPLFHSLIYLN